MNQSSFVRAGSMIGGLSLASLLFTGCLKDLGLGQPASSTGTGGGESSATSGAGGAFGVGGGPSNNSGNGGASFGVGTGPSNDSGTGGAVHGGGTSGVGGGPSDAGISFGTGGSSGGGTDAGVNSGSGGNSSVGTGGADAGPKCQLGATPVACDFSHLNADCAAYGAVCDFLFSQCSCCFIHEEVSCSSDADCEVTVGASSFCASGKCGCK